MPSNRKYLGIAPFPTVKLTRQECGKKRWVGISKEKRSAEMSERAKQLWIKIRAGKLTS